MSDADDREANIAKGCFSTLVFLVAIAIFVGIAFSNSSSRESSERSSVRWESYDVTIDVRDDGTLHVTEDQEVMFKGDFSRGYAEIPLDRIGSITNVAVTTEGRPPDTDGDGFLSLNERKGDGALMVGRRVDSLSGLSAGEFSYREVNGVLRIDYAFESTSGNDNPYYSAPQTRTIVLEYDVTGAIRDYPDAEEPWQQLHWMAISSEVTEIADIDAATVTINLPQDVPVDQLAWAPDPDMVTGNQLVWHRSDMGEGDDFDAQVAFPAITLATAPAWQLEADARDAAIAEAENKRSLASLLLLGAAVLVTVGGGIGLLYAWYTRIHETVPGLVDDVRSQPPGDLPAALVGTLVDEQVNPRDIAAAIMELDRRGIVEVVPAEPGSGGHAQYALTLKTPIDRAHPHERVILGRIFREDAKPPATESFDQLRPLFGAWRQEIQDALNQELVDRGYFHELPARSRRKWEIGLKVFVGASVVLAAGIVIALQSWSWWAILPPLAGVLIYVAGKRMTPSIARKTRQGAETAAKWRAFERYLQQTGGSVFREEWSTISAKYLPWVIAFGIDHQWLGRMNTPLAATGGFTGSPTMTAPSWMGGAERHGPDNRPVRTSSGGIGGSGWSPTWGGWDASRWSDMQGTSDGVLGSLGDASDSLFSMMGDAMEAIGKSSGSGRGGGRSSFGGGSSRSGGGRSRSSSGGGRRGFR